MSLQSFWRSGGLRSFVTSAASHIRTFSTSHATKTLPLDPVARRLRLDQLNKQAKIRCRTDSEWVKSCRENLRKFYGRRKEVTEEQREALLKQKRKNASKYYAEDPVYKLRNRVYSFARRLGWFREALPWKSHVPVVYAQKVIHSCDACLVTRYGGFQLWWKQRQSKDGKQSVDSRTTQGQEDEKYLCHKCYITGPEAMPEGYEDVRTVAELRARKEELGH